MVRHLKNNKVWRNKKKLSIRRNKISRWGVWKDRISNFIDVSILEKVTKKSITTKRSAAKKKALYNQARSRKKVTINVLKPKQDYFVKQALKQKIPLQKKSKNKRVWGQKNIASLTNSLKKFDLQKSFKNIRYYKMKWRVSERLHELILKSAGICAVIVIIYISFFDTFFLIKAYTIEYADGSYLSEDIAQDMVNHVKRERIAGIFPHNQLWFINSQNITLAAKSYSDAIQKVEVTKRQWPNQTALKITTKPIVATLHVNGNEYWRISEEGDVITEDTAEVKERLVHVSHPVYFDASGAKLIDYPLQRDEDQLNRIFFIDWLWNLLHNSGLEIEKTSIPSLQDTDVEITTTQKTALLFNSKSIKKEIQVARVEGIFNDPEIMKEFNEGVIDYIDFRIPKKIFICYKNTRCSQ